MLTGTDDQLPGQYGQNRGWKKPPQREKTGAILGKFITLFCFSALMLSAASGYAAAQYQQTITTELNEVRTGTLNGKDYLTVHIDAQVGPINCRGNVLRVDALSVTAHEQQDTLENIALAAVLNSEKVVITVPMHRNQCVEGMPTMTSMYLLPQVQ
jgi:hypothetical protein